MLLLMMIIPGKLKRNCLQRERERDLQVRHSSALTSIVPPLLIVSKHSSSLFLLACQILPPFITKGRARINAVVPLVLVVSEHASYTELGDGLMHGKEISQFGSA